MSRHSHRHGTCRFCSTAANRDNLARAGGKAKLIKYSVRHYAHADCLLRVKGVAAFELLTPWQCKHVFPVMVAIEFGEEFRLALLARADLDGAPPGATLDLPHTSAALDAYNATESARDRILANARTNEDVREWERAEREALTLVQHAFWLDTQDRNSRDVCGLVGIATLREWVEKYRARRGAA